MNMTDPLGGLTPEECQGFLADMIRIRVFEERCAELYGEQKIRGFLHLYIGEEAVATGVIAALRPEDGVVATYREHGHALALGVDPGRIMAEMYGNVEGVSMGRGGSMHLRMRPSRAGTARRLPRAPVRSRRHSTTWRPARRKRPCPDTRICSRPCPAPWSSGRAALRRNYATMRTA